MMQLLRLHPGHHVDPATLSTLHLFLRRALRLPWRKEEAVPASHPEAVAAAPAGERYECCWHCRSGYPCNPRDNHRDPCEHGCNDMPGGVVHVDGVLGTRMISEVRAEQEAARRARQHADAMHEGYARAVDRLRRDAGLPTVKEMRAMQAAAPAGHFPPLEPPLHAEPRERGHAPLTQVDICPARPVSDVPQPTNEQTRELYFGTAPQLEVEPELARRVLA